MQRDTIRQRYDSQMASEFLNPDPVARVRLRLGLRVLQGSVAPRYTIPSASPAHRRGSSRSSAACRHVAGHPAPRQAKRRVTGADSRNLCPQAAGLLGCRSAGVPCLPARLANEKGGAVSRAAPTKLLPDQQPATHLPSALNSMVLPESGTCTGTLLALMKVSVREPARTLPPTVPTSLACEAITAFGLTRSLMT